MSRIRRRRSHSAGGVGNIFFIAAVLTVLYLVLTGAAGKWVAQYIITPVAETFKQGKTGGNDTVVKELRLEPETMYFIQLGVYEREKNAEEQAASARLQGAAGYVLERDDCFRVLAWGYKEEREAKEVQQLLSGENTPSEIYVSKPKAVTLKVSGRSSEVQALQKSVEAYTALMDRLDALCADLEAEQIGAEGVKAELKGIAGEMETHLAALERMRDNSQDTAVQDIYRLYSHHHQAIGELQEQSSLLEELSAGIKFIYIDMYYSYADLISGWV